MLFSFYSLSSRGSICQYHLNMMQCKWMEWNDSAYMEIYLSTICWQLDSFTVPLHSANGRHLPALSTVQRDCHWGLKKYVSSHLPHEPIMQWSTRQSQSIFWLTNHKNDMPANWRSCLISHWESFSCNKSKSVHAWRPKQNVIHFTDDFFKIILLNDILCISIHCILFLWVQLKIGQQWCR